MVTENNEHIKGRYYETQKGAMSEGMISTDEYPPKKFIIKQGLIPKARIKMGRDTYNAYKFNQRKGTYYEKKRYVNDKSGERSGKGNFNWMRYLKVSDD